MTDIALGPSGFPADLGYLPGDAAITAGKHGKGDVSLDHVQVPVAKIREALSGERRRLLEQYLESQKNELGMISTHAFSEFVAYRSGGKSTANLARDVLRKLARQVLAEGLGPVVAAHGMARTKALSAEVDDWEAKNDSVFRAQGAVAAWNSVSAKAYSLCGHATLILEHGEANSSVAPHLAGVRAALAQAIERGNAVEEAIKAHVDAAIGAADARLEIVGAADWAERQGIVTRLDGLLTRGWMISAVPTFEERIPENQVSPRLAPKDALDHFVRLGEMWIGKGPGHVTTEHITSYDQLKAYVDAWAGKMSEKSIAPAAVSTPSDAALGSDP